MTTTLANNPTAQALYAFMSDISENVYAAGWMADCEWSLWWALTSWRAGQPAVWSFADITAHMPALDALHRAAGGWIWWLDYRDDRGGPQFVADERWARLVDERTREQGRISNERLNIRIR